MKPTPLKSIKIFKHEQLETMDEEQRKYAEQQLRHIWSRNHSHPKHTLYHTTPSFSTSTDEMAKVSASISKKQRVEKRLAELEHLQQLEIQQKIKSLTTKMSKVDSKRKEQLDKKIQSIKTHDDVWRQRLSVVERKIRSQNKEAEQKLQKYKDDYSSYLKKKELMNSEIEMKRNKETIVRHSSFYDPNTHVQSPTTKYLLPSTRSRATSVKKGMSKTQLDTQIRDHQYKSRMTQLQKEEQVFQKVLVKLDTIKTRRQKLLKNAQQRSSSRSINRESPLGRHRRSESSSIDLKRLKHTDNDKANNSVRSYSRNNVSALDRLKRGSEVLANKHQRQHQEVIQLKIYSVIMIMYDLVQFLKRGQILEDYQKRSKKEQILRSIRSKVTQFKILAQRNHVV